MLLAVGALAVAVVAAVVLVLSGAFGHSPGAAQTPGAGPSQNRPLGLQLLKIRPRAIQLTTGQKRDALLAGQLSDGSAASPATLGKVIWTSDNTAVATVSRDGIVTAHGPGEAIISARVGQVIAVVRVTVTGSPQPGSGPTTPAPPRPRPSSPVSTPPKPKPTPTQTPTPTPTPTDTPTPTPTPTPTDTPTPTPTPTS
jgi:hypothetical protein